MIPKRENIMLCYSWDKGREARLGKTYYVQPKLKGERCRVEWFKDEPVLISSFGNQFKFLDHITEALKNLRGFKRVPFDGELYKHGWSQQRINSAANRKVNKNEDSKMLEYHIFDIQKSSLLIEQRFWYIKILGIKPNSPLKRVPVYSNSGWKTIAADLVSQGYEGVVLKKMFSSYENKRSTSWIKFKPTETDEYIITGIEEAISKDGIPKGMLGAFWVSAPDEEISFKVGAGKLTHAKRIKIWKERETVVRKTLVVKHELTKTEKGIPECAVAVKVKD